MHIKLTVPAKKNFVYSKNGFLVVLYLNIFTEIEKKDIGKNVCAWAKKIFGKFLVYLVN